MTEVFCIAPVTAVIVFAIRGSSPDWPSRGVYVRDRKKNVITMYMGHGQHRVPKSWRTRCYEMLLQKCKTSTLQKASARPSLASSLCFLPCQSARFYSMPCRNGSAAASAVRSGAAQTPRSSAPARRSSRRSPTQFVLAYPTQLVSANQQPVMGAMPNESPKTANPVAPASPHRAASCSGQRGYQ